MSMTRFPGKLALQQRVLPNYRVPFFDLLASACDNDMALFTGLPRLDEGITPALKLQTAKYRLGTNIHLFHGSLYLCYQRGLMDWLRSENPDALILEANPRYLSTPRAIKWMHARGRKAIGWGLGAPSPHLRHSSPQVGRGETLRSRVGARAWSSFLGQFDALIAYSQRGADEYAALGFPREKIFVAHNSVSAPPESKPDRGPQTIDRVTILFVGRLQARKRVDFLLRACAQMPNPPRLMIVGEGPERAGLEALAREVYPSAKFIGTKYGAELKPYFTEADLFVLPGTGGLAVQEAMSYGLPVIVAKGDGTQDDLVRTGNGWQIPPEDFDALVSTMKNALSDITRLRKMGDEAYRIVAEEINIQKMVEVFMEVLNSTVHSS